MNAETIPLVTPMTVRKITPTHGMQLVGGVIVMDDYNVEDAGLVDERYKWDEDVVDCSGRIFEITSWMMMLEKGKRNFTVFPSRRWRNFREGEEIIRLPDQDHPLLYLGNPVRLFSDPNEGITVMRLPEFRIKTGMELGY